jgi:hypothetical protein
MKTSSAERRMFLSSIPDHCLCLEIAKLYVFICASREFPSILEVLLKNEWLLMQIIHFILKSHVRMK